MLDILNKILWAVCSGMIVISGLYFTFNLRFIQFKFKTMFKQIFKKTKLKDTITPFQTLMVVLAGRIGVGSIAGVALAIYLGGIGSIFWMWIIAFISAANAFSETVLGIKYKEKDKGNIYKGGPSYYMRRGLGNKKLGVIYAVLVLVSYIGGFISIQANTINKSLNQLFYVNPIIVGVVICILTSFIIFGGIKKIAKTSTKIVPIMTVFYVGAALYIVFTNIQLIPGVFRDIFISAFNMKSFFSGFLVSVIIGIQRGIFSNEAGIGTGAIAASTTSDMDATKQGFIQMMGVYITTMIICTATAIIILTSNYTSLNLTDVNGIEITQYAFNYHLGNTGSFIVFVSIVLFSFSTILAGYYNGESSLKYIFKKITDKKLLILKIVTLIVLFFGSIVPSNFLWSLVDLMVALLGILNIYALYKLREEVLEEVVYYNYKKCDKI